MISDAEVRRRRSARICDEIRDLVRARGRTTEELAAALGLSWRSVAAYCVWMERRGLLERRTRFRRGPRGGVRTYAMWWPPFEDVVTL